MSGVFFLEQVELIPDQLQRRERSPPAAALGAVAVGALAFGALAIGYLAISRLAVSRARIGRLEIDELIVRRIRREAQEEHR